MLTRLDLKNWVKTSRGLDRAADDGLLTNAFIDEAIDAVIKKVADDCNLLPVKMEFPLRIGQWEYPIPDDALRFRRVWFVDSSGTYLPLRYLTPEQLLDYRDPETDTSSDPAFFSYPIYQARVFGIYANAPPVYDYIFSSHVTSQHIFTVEDSGINLGRTLDGRRISPGDVVQNINDDSYGYVSVLDIITTKESGTADVGTDSDTLIDAAATFETNDVAENDIICITNADGDVVSYAWVDSITDENNLVYGDMRGAESSISSGDSYKIGVANKIRLDEATPHPYLREGAQNYFSVSDAKATIAGTTFTPTTVTGGATTGSEVDDIAIAAGGSHGKVTAVADNSLTVDWWVGGQPADGEEVTVRECDEYHIEGKMKDQRVMWISATPSESDDVGSESIVVTYNKQPTLPTADSDLIEIPDKYEVVLKKCLAWQAAELTGIYERGEIEAFEAYYDREVMKYRGDIWRPPDTQPLSVWDNRYGAGYVGVKDQSPSGMKWNLDI